VVTSVAEAEIRVAAGERVVVVVSADEAAQVAALGKAGGLPAVMVGHPEDPAVLAAAAQMAAEMGARPTPGAGSGGG
jgi:hypothetical protein